MFVNKVFLGVQPREPANMVWDRLILAKQQEAAAARLKAKNEKNTQDLPFVPDPQSS